MIYIDKLYLDIDAKRK